MFAVTVASRRRSSLWYSLPLSNSTPCSISFSHRHRTTAECRWQQQPRRPAIATSRGRSKGSAQATIDRKARQGRGAQQRQEEGDEKGLRSVARASLFSSLVSSSPRLVSRSSSCSHSLPEDLCVLLRLLEAALAVLGLHLQVSRVDGSERAAVASKEDEGIVLEGRQSGLGGQGRG